MMPLMDPRFNMREVAKQLLLLEDHLTQPQRRCGDCIRKHFAMAEALSEEAMTLRPSSVAGAGETKRGHRRRQRSSVSVAAAAAVQEGLRRLQADLLHGRVSYEQAAQQIRALRKPLLKETTEWLLRHNEAYR
jgi:hypothetical protein